MQVSTQGPTAETPTAETPPAEAPTAETPPAEAPTAEAPTAEAPTSDLAELANDLYALVVYLHKTCTHDLLEAVGALELTITQIKLLHHLERAERELTLKQAAELVLVSLPAASRMVDDLVRRGFVERHEDAEDRRMKRVSLTERGGSVIRRLNAARLNRLEQFTWTLTEAERLRLSAALTQLLERDEIAACRPEGPDTAPSRPKGLMT